MIHHDTALKLQAYVDGELPPRETAAMRHLLESDAQARSLVDALRAAKSALAGNEPEFRLADSREFYWSGIRRRIEAEERQTAARQTRESEATGWSRFLAPAGILAGLALFIALALNNRDDASRMLALEEGHEIETPLEETTSFSFRSESAAMTVVWVDSHRQ